MAGTIYPHIEERRQELGTPKNLMASRLGISYDALRNKLDGKSEFTAGELKKIALWWGVSVDYLIGVEDERKEEEQCPTSP